MLRFSHIQFINFKVTIDILLLYLFNLSCNSMFKLKSPYIFNYKIFLLQNNILPIFNHLNEASADRIIQKRFFYNFFLFGLILWKIFARKTCDHYILLQYEWVKRIWPVDTFFVDRTETFKIFSFLDICNNLSFPTTSKVYLLYLFFISVWKCLLMSILICFLHSTFSL